MSHALIVPMAAHVALAAGLYVLLTVARAPAVWGIGRTPGGGHPWAGIEPRISANLSNQFEWPLFFHVACLILLTLPADRTALVGAGKARHRDGSRRPGDPAATGRAADGALRARVSACRSS